MCKVKFLISRRYWLRKCTYSLLFMGLCNVKNQIAFLIYVVNLDVQRIFFLPDRDCFLASKQKVWKYHVWWYRFVNFWADFAGKKSVWICERYALNILCIKLQICVDSNCQQRDTPPLSRINARNDPNLVIEALWHCANKLRTTIQVDINKFA